MLITKKKGGEGGRTQGMWIKTLPAYLAWIPESLSEVTLDAGYEVTDAQGIALRV